MRAEQLEVLTDLITSYADLIVAGLIPPHLRDIEEDVLVLKLAREQFPLCSSPESSQLWLALTLAFDRAAAALALCQKDRKKEFAEAIAGL